MNPLPHDVARARRIPVPTGLDALAFAFRFTSVLPALAAQAGMACASRATQACLHRHVVVAHDLAEAMRSHVDWRERARERTWPAGPWHAAAAVTDRMHRIAVAAWANTAAEFGRAFAHKAFAFPVVPLHR